MPFWYRERKWVMASRLAASLTSARERRGLSREALAHRSGLSWAAITQIESGRRQEVRASTLIALANALGVSVDYLLGGATTTASGLLNHRVLTYGSDDEYVAPLVAYMEEGIARDDCVLAVTTQSHASMLQDALGVNADHVEFRDATAWYRSLPGAANGYRSYVKERYEGGAAWTRIVGEPVWTEYTDAELAEWFRYEALINLSFASSPATVVCMYDTRTTPQGALDDAFRTHPQVGAVDVAASATYREPEDLLLTLT
jgi:transcriptional regulator with XRE-family HTH domain